VSAGLRGRSGRDAPTDPPYRAARELRSISARPPPALSLALATAPVTLGQMVQCEGRRGDAWTLLNIWRVFRTTTPNLLHSAVLKTLC
jgi:hypothetical protein